MAKVLTGISGNVISAASAGFAPTNSADVSAIASAYQVVSATGTQLYAGTAYVTSVNDAPLSASRAGQAANASLANSAYYDGTGRLISSLPDSAAVSAIASAYAESAASGKLDYSAVGIDSEMMVVSSIDDIYVSAWIAGSAEHWSGASSKQDTLTFSYDDDKISAINGSALAGQGGGGSVASPSGTIIVTDGTAIEATNSAIGTAEGLDVNNSGQANRSVYPSSYEYLGSYSTFKARGIGLTYNSSNATRTAWVSANTNLGNLVSSFVLPASSVSAGGLLSTSNIDSVWDSQIKVDGGSLTLSGSYPVLFVTTGEPYSVVKELAWASALPTYSYDSEDKISAINGSALAGQGGGGGGGSYVETTAQVVDIGSGNTSYPGNTGVFIQGVGNENNGSNFIFAQGIGNYVNGSDCFAQGDYNRCEDSYSMAQGWYNTAKRSLSQGLSNCAERYSFAQGSYSTAYGVSFAQGSGVSAKNTASVFGTYNLSGNGSASSGAAFVLGDGTATAARHDLMVVTKDGEITMYSGTADTVGTGIMSSIRAISAAATGGGGVDSATVSAIASSYAESAASSKLDTTAFNSADFYATSNPSGFIDSAYVDSAVSSKADSSAMSSYALSADVSGTVDLVSTQSANWGGSALQLSAGAGISLTLSGNVLIIATAV